MVLVDPLRSTARTRLAFCEETGCARCEYARWNHARLKACLMPSTFFARNLTWERSATCFQHRRFILVTAKIPFAREDEFPLSVLFEDNPMLEPEVLVYLPAQPERGFDFVSALD